jgi:hypothetical protein
MNVKSSRKTVDEIVGAIQALDLEPIKFKLMDADEGQGWSRAYVEQMAVAYKRFLTLLVTHPETPIAPSKDIDKFWHGHILDTMKYAEDCEKVFGYFLHHFPYFGMRGEQDAAALNQAGDAMQQLYKQQFGEEMPQSRQADGAYCFAAKKADAAYCFAANPSYCFAAKAETPSYCFAAKNVDAAYCFAAKSGNDSAYCFASGKVDITTRPTLALAA